MLMLAKSLGRVNYFDETKERELLDLKQKWGWADPRNTPEYKNCDICANDIFRDSWKQSGVERKAFDAPPAMGPNAAAAIKKEVAAAVPAALPAGTDQEALIKMITERVMEALAAGK
jgi:L-fuculose-phosphate aldolase